jgi:hypothetical protein
MRKIRRGIGLVWLAVLAAVIVASGPVVASAADSGWAIQSLPTPAVAPNGQLTGASCASNTSCIAVGVAQDDAGRDVALAETWNGARWEGLSTPRPAGAIGAFLAAVACTSANECTAVGNLLNGANQHVPLAERWNGREWQIQSTPNPGGATDSFLSGVACSSATACTAVGSTQTSAGLTVTLAERWNGRDWQVQSTPNPDNVPDNVLSGVSCTSSTACTAVGKSTTNFLTPQALIERWNGSNWEIQPSVGPVGASGSSLTGVSCANRTTCTAVGNYVAKSTKAGGTLAEQWDGLTWTVQPTPGQSLDVFDAVSCATANACTAVGHTGLSVPTIARWDGSTWLSETAATPSSAFETTLVGVSCPTRATCVAIGSALYTSGGGPNLSVVERWNGAEWTLQASFNPTGATAHGLTAVSCATNRDCMAVGYAFDAAGQRNPLAEEWNGTTWTVQSTPRPTGALDSYFSGVSCSAVRACTAVGFSVDSAGAQITLIERWNGSNWSIQSSPPVPDGTASVLYSVSCADRSECTAAGAYFDTAGVTQTLVERWTGTTWKIQPTPNPAGSQYVAFNGVSCPGPKDCTAVGLNIDSGFNFLTIAEHWNGTDWQIQPTPNPLGQDGANGTFEGGVSCPTLRACTAVGQFSPAPAPHPGVTLAEHWNGTSWQVQTTPHPAPVDGPNGTQNGPFEGVSCATASDCVAVGNYDSGPTFRPLAELWNGNTWSVLQPAAPVGTFIAEFAGVSCPTARMCMTVGDSTRINASTLTRGRPVALAERYSAGDD